ncbi:MAG: TRAP transporter substrate-binding protein DctP [Thermodesulfobacteriota bacterium]
MNAKRALVFLLVFLALAGSLHAGDKKKPRFYWKTATLAPDGIGWAKHMKDLIFPEMEKSTRGELQVKTYWGGVMGDEEDYIKKIRIGQLQGAGLSAQGSAQACKDIAVLELPFLFNNYNEVDFLRVKLSNTFDELFAEQGFFLVGWIDQDFDQIYSSKYPMDKLEDFKKSRFITWYGPMEEDMLRVLGAEPIPVNVPELSAAIRQGVANASIGPAVWLVGAQLYSVVKYVNPVKIRYSPATIIITLEAWNSLPEEYRKDFYMQRLELGWRYCNLVRKDNVKFLQAMIDYGVKEVKMDPKNYAEVEQKAKSIWPHEVGRLFDKRIYGEVVDYLAQYRAGKRLTLDDLLVMAKVDMSKPVPPEFRKRLEAMVESNMAEFGVASGTLVEKPAK